MLYYLNDLRSLSFKGGRGAATTLKKALDNPYSPFSYMPGSRALSAACELFERTTRRFGKPAFEIESVSIEGRSYDIEEEVIMERPFCHLIHFKKKGFKGSQPAVLMVAPLSGHYATLLRDTVKAMLNDHDVYITDWMDARDVPLSMGDFDFDTYTQYMIDFMKFLGPDIHVLAVCQPAVQVLIAVGILSAAHDPKTPKSMILMGGPIDTRINPTQVDEFATNNSMEWFKNTFITTVPAYYPGAGRKIYPGFMQLTGFISMHLDRHVTAHAEFFNHLIQGDEDGAMAHRKFYDEYLAVMDMPAEYFLTSVEKVFKTHELPTGKLMWKGKKVDLSAIETTALMTIEGEHDDISAPGQTLVAHDLCPNIPAAKRNKLFQLGVGHYGIFNGRKWREQIMPQIRTFIQSLSH